MKKHIIIPAIALSFVFAGTANAGFFDWFKNTPLNQEASIISAAKDAESAKILELQIKATAPATVPSYKTYDSLSPGPSTNQITYTCSSSNTTIEVTIQGDAGNSILLFVDNVAWYCRHSYFMVANIPPVTKDTLELAVSKVLSTKSSNKLRSQSNQSGCTSRTSPWVKVTSPNGGETYSQGGNITVFWNTCNIPLTTNMQINIFAPGHGVGVVHALNSVGQATVQIPANQFVGNKYKAVVDAPSITGDPFDSSNNSFSIIKSNSPIPNEDPSAKSQIVSNQDAKVNTGDSAHITEKLSRSSKPKEQVKILQTTLTNVGVYTGAINGIFGPRTQKAVEEFQKSRNIKPDGVVGEKTRLSLNTIIDGKDPIGEAYINLSDGVIKDGPNIPQCGAGSPQSLTVTTPNGGNTYWAGGNISIRWRRCKIANGAQIKVELLNYSQGLVLNTANATNSTDSGLQNFTIPTSAINGLFYRARVTLVSNNTVTDMSDNLFTIQNNCTATIVRDPSDSSNGAIYMTTYVPTTNTTEIIGPDGNLVGSYEWTGTVNRAPMMKIKITANNCTVKLKDIK